MRVRRIFPSVSANELLLAGTTLLLVAIGVVMVLSSSTVESYAGGNGSFFSEFVKQGAFAFVGLGLMLLASRMPAKFWKRIAWSAVLVGVALQALVFTPLGFGYGGNRNWLGIGSFSLQPSEFVKVALCVWLGYIMTVKQPRIDRFWHAWIPVLPIAGLSIMLVLLGNDLGTVAIMVGLTLGAMWFAGVKWWHIAGPILLLGAVAVPVVMMSESRVRRIQTFLAGCQNTDFDYYSIGGCWQQLHGTWALANGGLFGVGLGNSRAKWNWLPEADNDYIFAIVGEELGLIGATVVLLLFVLLAVALLRIIRASESQFTRVVTGAVLVWIVGQAVVNVAVVLGLLPVLGVPLPFMSAGGSQMISGLLAIGVVLSLARSDAAARRMVRG